VSEQPNRRRKGRWAPDSVLNALERRYALILGLHATAERECEELGGAALIEAQDRIESDQELMRRTMAAIEVVGREFDPSWQPSRIKPIYPRKTDELTGQMSRTAWRVMREAGRLMTAREIAREVVLLLGAPEDEATVARVEIAIRGALKYATGDGGVYVVEGPTRLYGLVPEQAL
jgi:hypothetical protein